MRLQRLILIRHGESVGNEAASAAEFSGDEVIDLPFRDADTPLSPTGEAQADALGTALRELGVGLEAAVWTSPYRRAMQTSARALDAADLERAAMADERLRDRELGILDHLTSHGTLARYPSETERRAHLGKFFYRPPGGESWADVALRLRSFLAEAQGGSAETGVVFAHEAIIHLLRYVLEGWDEHQVLAAAVEAPAPNASVTLLERDPAGAWVASVVGDVTHLREHGVEATLHTGRPDPRVNRATEAAEEVSHVSAE
ncbi:histidine phosphatase family protein [Microbacterium oryzae]|uniref:phosphoglycerate mutase (2,3-diphosphoglycerate-dependent) n=1 Tax=Microbacterium oryzae TaxID=743009 RepID=A0A6I6DZ53_9MICO|nr:histidine phosphatase family protein [Microbacterium oryzae]QGU27244.1 histidine phosphatase family protein [Microbacterium oryzae]